MTFFQRVTLVLQPISDDLVPFLGFDALVIVILTVLIAVVIFRNRRKNQSITFEVENLIRRYVVFRGHRQALIKVHQGDENLKHEMLKSISNSWNHFKNMLESHSAALRETDRRARTWLCILGILIVLNSLRTLASGVMVNRVEWGFPIFLLKELPIYLFLLTGFLLISIQSRRWDKRPLTGFDGELDAIFSDAEKTQDALNNEFDPIEQSFWKEEP
jgi:hypothetical protein